jgi:hypothetical protein
MKTRRYLSLAAVFVALSLSSAGISQLIDRARAAFTLPGTNGPSLGDFNVNPFTLAQAINLMNQAATSPAITANVANTQATCAAIVNPLNLVTTSVATGSLCLPPAFAGRMVWITNATGNGLNLFGSNTPFVAGTADTINGSTGATANTTVLPAAGSTAHKTAICHSAVNGGWDCNIATGP